MKNPVRLISLTGFYCADLPLDRPIDLLPVFPEDALAGIPVELPETGYEVEDNSLELEWTVLGPTIATYVRDTDSDQPGVNRTVGKWVEGAGYFKLM